MLPLLIIACLGYLIFAISAISKELSESDFREADALPPVMKFTFAGGVPLVVAATMTYLFLIVGGETTAQLNAGNPSGINVWSAWVGLFPTFLLMTVASSFGAFVWFLVCAFKKSMRPSVSLSIASFLLSVLAFVTVATNFPSA